jgi:hypothetical protein
MKRYTAYEGINQSGIIQRALERELWRFEKELTRKLRAQKEIELSEDDSDK